MDLKEKSFEY